MFFNRNDFQNSITSSKIVVICCSRHLPIIHQGVQMPIRTHPMIVRSMDEFARANQENRFQPRRNDLPRQPLRNQPLQQVAPLVHTPVAVSQAPMVMSQTPVIVPQAPVLTSQALRSSPEQNVTPAVHVTTANPNDKFTCLKCKVNFDNVKRTVDHFRSGVAGKNPFLD